MKRYLVSGLGFPRISLLDDGVDSSRTWFSIKPPDIVFTHLFNAEVFHISRDDHDCEPRRRHRHFAATSDPVLFPLPDAVELSSADLALVLPNLSPVYCRLLASYIHACRHHDPMGTTLNMSGATLVVPAFNDGTVLFHVYVRVNKNSIS
jgi:hypothetical protein